MDDVNITFAQFCMEENHTTQRQGCGDSFMSVRNNPLRLFDLSLAHCFTEN